MCRKTGSDIAPLAPLFSVWRPVRYRTEAGGPVDGVSSDEAVAIATHATIRELCQRHPTIYLPTHDPWSADRLVNRQAAPLDALHGSAWTLTFGFIPHTAPGPPHHAPDEIKRRKTGR